MTKKRKGRLGTPEALLRKHHVRRQKSTFKRREPARARGHHRVPKPPAPEPEEHVSGDFRPGDRVVFRGRALWSMGLIAGELGGAVFVVEACACDLCGLGRHVAVEGGRHIARAALRRVGELCVDELRAVDSDALTASIQAGISRAARGR